MNEQQWKGVIENINIREEIESKIIENVKSRMIKQPVKYKWMRTAAAFAIVLFCVGVVGITAKAVVDSFIRFRMESLPEEDMQHLAETLETQTVNIDSFIRDYTKEEMEAMSDLTEQYYNGQFPINTILQVESAEDVLSDTLCYVTETSTFYLPDRMLTEEEMLQIIDFNYQRNYALTINYDEEYLAELAERKVVESESIAGIVEEGGISEDEAIIIAEGWLNKLYNKDAGNMEQNSYLDEESNHFASDGSNSTYCVNWGIQSHHNYYFYIDPINGKLIWADYSGDDLNSGVVSEEELLEKMPKVYELATAFLVERLGITEKPEHINCSYILQGDQTIEGEFITFYYGFKDGTTYCLSYSGDTFSTYENTTEELILEYNDMLVENFEDSDLEFKIIDLK